jgi:FkbM family methyltransferase
VTPPRRIARIAAPGFAPFSLRVHPPGELVSDLLVREGIWEPFETAVLGRLLGPGDCVLDVGANVGYYTHLAAQRVGTRGRVVAVEPDPDNFRLLCANAAALARLPVTLHRVALGARAVAGALCADPSNRGDAYLADSAGGSGPVGAPHPRVVVRPGDALELAHVHLVKIDTQGAECSVLDGLAHTLARSRSDLSLLVELWPFGLVRCGSSAEALVERLLALDLPVFRLDHQVHALVPLDAVALEDLACRVLTVAERGFVNLLLTTRTERLHTAASA